MEQDAQQAVAPRGVRVHGPAGDAVLGQDGQDAVDHDALAPQQQDPILLRQVGDGLAIERGRDLGEVVRVHRRAHGAHEQAVVVVRELHQGDDLVRADQVQLVREGAEVLVVDHRRPIDDRLRDRGAVELLDLVEAVVAADLVDHVALGLGDQDQVVAVVVADVREAEGLAVLRVDLEHDPATGLDHLGQAGLQLQPAQVPSVGEGVEDDVVEVRRLVSHGSSNALFRQQRSETNVDTVTCRIQKTVPGL